MEEWTSFLPYRPHKKLGYERYHHGPHYILFTAEEGIAATGKLLSNVNRETMEVIKVLILNNLYD